MPTTKMMISLDYELFFGPEAGSVENCLVSPVTALLDVLNKYAAKLTLFVDAGYLIRLRDQATQHPQLGADLTAVKRHLEQVSQAGHDIQLHIHPHWEDSHFDGKQWCFDTSRYRLHDFNEIEIGRIVRDYKHELEGLSCHEVFAYRAGGWCIQPFDKIKAALLANGVWLDSTVYKHGLSEDPSRWYDFRHTSAAPWWYFSDDPTQEDKQGPFVQIPISTVPLSPLFFWKMALVKKLASRRLKPFGDGQVMPQTSGYYLSRLTQTTFSPASIDGVKASTLSQALNYHLRHEREGIFNVMGHPKALSPYSIEQVDRFLAKQRQMEYITFQDLRGTKIEIS